MEFIFFCPVSRRRFETPDFEVTENRGIRNDENGNRYLDAAVVLTSPCPDCGAYHRYRATELSCPFQTPSPGDSGR